MLIVAVYLGYIVVNNNFQTTSSQSNILLQFLHTSANLKISRIATGCGRCVAIFAIIVGVALCTIVVVLFVVALSTIVLLVLWLKVETKNENEKEVWRQNNRPYGTGIRPCPLIECKV